MEAPTQPSDILTVVKITDAHLDDLYTNRALAEITGYDPDELERIGWMNIVDSQAQSLFEEIVQSVDKMPYVRECFETNIICRDGSRRVLAWEVVSLAPDRFPVMLITARESQQKRLPPPGFVRTRQVSSIPGSLWQDVFNTLPDCISIHNENFTILAANDALCERLGLSRSEVIGRKCHEIFHGLAQPVEHCVLVRTSSGLCAQRVQREAYERVFKGISQIEAVPFPSSKAGQYRIIHILRTADSFEAGFGAATRRELDSLSRLASAIAHDYNNLLSGIVGYTGMLQTLPDLPQKAAQYVAELQKSATRLNEMTQRLLLFGRQRVSRHQFLDLNQLVAEALCSPDIVPTDRMVRFDQATESVHANCDPMQIRIVLTNLVQNALEANRAAGGEVIVRVSRRRSPNPFPTFFTVAPAGDYATIEVRDSGAGIDPQRLVHIFEPFRQTDGRHIGRGLGLAIVYRIVQNHNGYIEIESEPGLGTRISILLPASSPAPTNQVSQ